MAVFSGLSDRLNHIFSKLKDKGALTELEVKAAMREVRIALLEADVNLQVAKNFVNTVTEKAIGADILKSLSPVQQVIKIVNDELVTLMGSTHQKLNFGDSVPAVIMMCGLQGAGKTTMCGKLAAYLKKQGKTVMLVACDIYRPAAIKQLQVVGEKAGVIVFERGATNPVAIAKDAIAEAKNKLIDVVIVDTAGRLHIDETLMSELKNIKASVKPMEILLTVDSMLGQDAVTVAEKFNADLDITGVVLTKLDGDTRGGAALSIRAMTGKPIKFSGIGEKMTDLEPFHPDRMASRILGMGDVLTLIEKAQSAITEDEARKMQKKLKENSFTLDDFLIQFEAMKKMGGMKDVLGMIPGMAGKLSEDDMSANEKVMSKSKAIIQSMTTEERTRPDTIKSSHKKRIAVGSGSSIQEVNQLLKQYEQTREMMKQFQGGKMGRFGKKLPF